MYRILDVAVIIDLRDPIRDFFLRTGLRSAANWRVYNSPDFVEMRHMHRAFKIRLLENRYPALHGLRVVTILIAVHMHVMLHVALVLDIGKYQFSTDWLRFALNSGWQTMDFFFVLSGFLIGKILLDAQNTDGFSLKSTLVFYVKRGFRIFPLYYVTLFGLWGIVQFWPIFSVNGATKINWIPEIFYLSNYMRDQVVLAPWSWSLSLEEHLYLAAPFVVAGSFMISTMRLKIVAIFIGILVPLALRYLRVEQSIGIEAPPLNLFKDLFIPTHMRFDTFLFGFVGAILFFEKREWLEHIFKKLWVRCLMWTFVAAIYFYFISPEYHRIPFMLPSYAGFLNSVELASVARMAIWDFGFLSGLMYLVLILLLTTEDGWLKRMLGSNFMRQTATLSYGVYLVHLPIAKFISYIVFQSEFFGAMSEPDQIVGTVISSYIITLVASYWISYTLHLLVEKPLLSIRDRIFA